MLYQRTLPVPANTLATAPAEAEVTIKHPVISRITTHFPDGCVSMVEVAMFYGDLQLYPDKDAEWLKGNAINIVDEPYFEMPERETRLRFLGRSPNTIYSHNIIFYITAIDLKDVPPTREITRVADLFEEYLTLIGAR